MTLRRPSDSNWIVGAAMHKSHAARDRGIRITVILLHSAALHATSVVGHARRAARISRVQLIASMLVDWPEPAICRKWNSAAMMPVGIGRDIKFGTNTI
ncbi:MAG: hypothetical protein Pars92KO_31420 [Parasphingorhabdus sp.]